MYLALFVVELTDCEKF